MSFGAPSLNDLIDKELSRVAYDSLISFAPYMTEIDPGNGFRILWKSDVARAYRNLPMAPQWQVRQIVKIDNLFYADRCANFGSAASPKLWCSVFSLALWIAVNVLGVRRINNLMDDTWGIAHSNSITTYKDNQMPLDQALLLLLFDTIKMPWEWKKQLAAPQLEIIGHQVDASDLSFSLAPEKKAALVEALRAFTRAPHHRLRDWQRLLGWASWGLNAFPYGRHALQ